MCEQTGEEIDWEKCPPELDDFPESVITALTIFNSLGNRIYPDVGFIGKDYTNLSLLYKLYGIEETIEKDYIFELLIFMDNKTQEDSRKRIKVEMDKIKRK
jgi:hypothetical protein